MNNSNFPLNRTIYAIQHIAFEGLDALEDIFYQHGFRIRYFEAGIDDLSTALEYDGLTIILGGPIGVYEQEDYPFLTAEIAGLQKRLSQNKPTLGICLGAQLIAHALGAKVYAGQQKEIGWSKLQILDIKENPLNSLTDVPVLHWHGDTFELPKHATLLASSDIYPNQAFSVGNSILALQFHLEVTYESLEAWLIGNTTELRQAGISIPQLRQENAKHAENLEHATKQVIANFLKNLEI